ncbi:50S ribosomal protein L28 [Candidatus Mycoplasma haematolamae str. Purdue]|uniref:50S ribosomal protein L28 n=1 Tax=Mycoplasma haematolamae (strain Purdue) TaxID=1212765 RepID=I7B937_MYCHA|nr:50S ribosomal protein L28 [Candidatus Mycoplasma haematolamae str. Purdue]
MGSRLDRVTGRASITGNNRSKAMNATKRAWNLNIQNFQLVCAQTGLPFRVRTSVKTVRTWKKQGKIK